MRRSELPDGPSPFLDTAAGEAAEDVSDTINDLEITTLTNTTSLHDDWLHRGPFLADLDLHTYIAHVVRIPRPAAARVSDIQRFQDVFLFDDHYELARSHWQERQTRGFRSLPMLEALRCQPPDLNNGEDNAVYKTLFGTLLACPGKSRCSDPLLYRPAFFASPELGRSNCRQQWQARRAEIEGLATRADQKCNAAKRIPVLADTMLLRTHVSDTRKAPSTVILCCLTQWWIQQCGRALPCFASRILAF